MVIGKDYLKLKNTPFIREGALTGAKNEQTIISMVATCLLLGQSCEKNGETNIVNMVATRSIRDRALPGATAREAVNNEETSIVNMVATRSIRDGALPGATAREAVNNEQSDTMLELPKLNQQNLCQKQCTKYSLVTTHHVNKNRANVYRNGNVSILFAIIIIFIILFNLYTVIELGYNVNNHQNLHTKCTNNKTVDYNNCTSYYFYFFCPVKLFILLFLVFIFKQLDFYYNMYLTQSFDECVSHAFESCVKVNEKSTLLIPVKDCRSRYAKFTSLYYNRLQTLHSIHVQRERAPSRLPQKQLTCAFFKKRSIRRTEKKQIKRTIPKSSKIRNVYAYNQRQ